MGEPMESRLYTLDEIEELAEGKRRKKFAFLIGLDQEDFMYEDSAMLKISIPRGMWKILYGAAKSNNCDVSEIASDFLADHIWDIWQQSRKLPISGSN